MCGRLPASRTHFSRKIGAVLGIHRNCWAKLLPPSWIDGVFFLFMFFSFCLWVSILILFVCSGNEVIVGRGQKPGAKRWDWSLCLSPEMKSFLSASRLKCLTAAQELRFATLWCDARLLPGWRWLFLAIAREKVFWKRTWDTRLRQGEKNKKKKILCATNIFSPWVSAALSPLSGALWVRLLSHETQVPSSLGFDGTYLDCRLFITWAFASFMSSFCLPGEGRSESVAVPNTKRILYYQRLDK